MRSTVRPKPASRACNKRKWCSHILVAVWSIAWPHSSCWCLKYSRKPPRLRGNPPLGFQSTSTTPFVPWEDALLSACLTGLCFDQHSTLSSVGNSQTRAENIKIPELQLRRVGPAAKLRYLILRYPIYLVLLVTVVWLCLSSNTCLHFYLHHNYTASIKLQKRRTCLTHPVPLTLLMLRLVDSLRTRIGS